MAFIHHPALDVDVEVPDDTVEIWCGDPGWRPGTRENPEPWEPPASDSDGELVPNPVEPPTVAGRSAATSAPTGDTNTTPTKED